MHLISLIAGKEIILLKYSIIALKEADVIAV